MKLLGKESLKYKIVEQSTISGDETESGFPNRTVSEQMSAASFTGPRLIDKDDPRSRLHFVKYLKRDGKTLKIWECGICTKEFRHQYTLMRHLPTHTDERNFKCDACGKAFRQLSTLSQHKAIHSDARPYVCEFCKKTFNRVSTLISHRKTHSELKPHKCHVCGKGFHQKGNLRNHVFTHTNERPYKCEMCGKGFNQMSNLVCHKIKAHAHSEKMQYSCGICGKEFPRRFALRSHEEYKHGIKYRNPGGISRERKPPSNQKSSTSTSACSTASSAICNATPATTVTTTCSSVMQNKNVRIVELPDHERNEELTAVETSQTEYTDSIVINRIETKDLQNAIMEGQTPFALLKPVTGIPVLVKVSPAGPHKHLLTPATAEDLQMLGKMALSPSVDAGLKASHIKVPVVATITQHLDDDGKQSFSIEAPGADQNQESLVAPLDSQFPFQNTESSLRLHSASAANVCATIRTIDDIAIEGNVQAKSATATTEGATSSQPDDCNELLELAAQGGIQFVRATEDGRYEVMTNNEARELMAQNSHDVTILDGADADALNIVNARAGETTSGACCLQEDFTIDHPDSQIMVLDSIANCQKSVDLEAIDIFEDKDIRILDPKSFDERIIDGMTFLSQMKMDDLVFVPSSKSCTADGMNGCAITIASPSNEPADFTGLAAILNNGRNNCANGQSMSVTSLLTKAQHSSNLSIISDTVNYLRHCPARNTCEESGVPEADEEPTVCALDNHHRRHHRRQQQPRIYQAQEHYTGQTKFNDFEDAMDTGESSDLTPFGEHERNDRGLSVNTADRYHDSEANASYWDHKRSNAVALAEAKCLLPKNNNDANRQEASGNPAAQFQDIRVLGSYEQYLNSSGFGHKEFLASGSDYATDDGARSSGRKEVKILGKRLECGFLENDENGKLIKIEDEAGGMDGVVTCRRIANDFWEGWIETNRTANNDAACDREEDDNERNNDIAYGSIIDSQTL